MSQDTRARLARDAGYQGDQAEAFASLLVGETDDELTAHAVKVAELLGSLGDQAEAKPYVPGGEQDSRPVRATDPSQGHTGGGHADTGAAFARRIRDHLRAAGSEYNPFRLTIGTHSRGT